MKRVLGIGVFPGWLLGLFFMLGAGCFPPFGDSRDGGSPETQAVDEYNQLEQKLVANRRDFVTKTYSYQLAVGNSLYFLDFAYGPAVLHRYDQTAGARIDYTFNINQGLNFSYQASESMIVTPSNRYARLEYQAYDANSPNTLLGSTPFDPPGNSDFWAYSVSGNQLYVITQDGTSTNVYRWTPGGINTLLFTLEKATGQTSLSDVAGVGVNGNIMVFWENGRLWRVDINAQRAVWLRNMTVAGDTIDIAPDGITFTAHDLFFFDVAQQTRNLSDLIKQSSYKLNDIFSTIHYHTGSEELARFGSYVIYRGQDGIFAYDLQDNHVQPVLLDPRDQDSYGNSIRYRFPTVLLSGFMYVTGLLGADGAIYEVDLKKVLQ